MATIYRSESCAEKLLAVKAWEVLGDLLLVTAQRERFALYVDARDTLSRALALLLDEVDGNEG